MAKYLVTGGAGFIGSHLVESLVGDGGEVVVLDNFHTGNEGNLGWAGGKVEIIRGDCTELLKKEIEVDGIYHLGMFSSSPMYKKEPLLVSRVVNDAICVLEFARKNKIKVVFASSSSIYNGNKPPWREDMEIFVSDYYTEARYYVERIAKLYNILFGVKSVGLRFFSVYGPREEGKGNFANLVSQFLWAMKRGERPVIYGDGGQIRDFIYVEDVVRGIKLCMEKELDCEIFNLGTGFGTDLNRLVEILNEVLGTSIKAEYVNNPISNYVAATVSDCSKAKRVLGFSAKYSLIEGIRKMIGEKG